MFKAWLAETKLLLEYSLSHTDLTTSVSVIFLLKNCEELAQQKLPRFFRQKTVRIFAYDNDMLKILTSGKLTTSLGRTTGPNFS